MIEFIAEIGANHCQDIDLAYQLIHAAKSAGATGVKLQVYKPESLTVDSSLPEFTITGGTPWDGMTYYELYKKTMTPWEWIPELKREIESLDMDFIGTPYCKESLEYLCNVDCRTFKVSSFESYDGAFTREVLSHAKRLILSDNNNRGETIPGNIIYLQCVSQYPANHYPGRPKHGLQWGLSDHTTDSISAVLAAHDGAVMIEKHLKLDNVKRNGYGHDYSFSVLPSAFAEMVKSVRRVIELKKPLSYNPLQHARSMRAVCDIKAGEMLTDDNVRSIRPGGGMHPDTWREVRGSRARKDYQKGEAIEKD